MMPVERTNQICECEGPVSDDGHSGCRERGSTEIHGELDQYAGKPGKMIFAKHITPGVIKGDHISC